MIDHEPNINIQLGDCIPGMKDTIDDDAIDCVITSIPFGALFSYSHKHADIGNNLDGTDMHTGQFALHMRFFIEQLYRVMTPGAVACIHIQQLLRWKVQHGYMGMRDFRGAIITLFANHGFQVHGEVAIVKNPQTVARRLNLHSLMFATAYKDSRKLAPAMNDYVLFFKKPGDGVQIKGLIEANRNIWLKEPSDIITVSACCAIKQVDPEYQTKPYIIREYNEKTNTYRDKETTGGAHINPDGWFTKNDWVKWARGAWEDILEIDTLDGWRCARESDEEKHVCPLQLETIRRCMKLYSAPGQTVMDPFMGIGSTAYVAHEQGRDCVGFELKESYYDLAIRNVEKARMKKPQMKLEEYLKAS